MQRQRRIRALTGMSLVAFGAGLLGASSVRAADPTLQDCIQANETALQLRREGRLRQARSQWSVCTSQSCGPEIIKACRTRIEELNPAIPTVVFEVTDASGKALTAVKVLMDGQPLVDRLEGTAVSLDPGKHTLTFEVEGQPPVQKEIELFEADKERPVAVVIGAPAAPTPSSPASGEPAPSTVDGAVASPGAPSSAGGGGWSTQRWMALGLAGVGLVGVVIGAVEGISASSSWSNSKNDCSQTNCPSSQRPQALNDHDSAESSATVSTVAFAAGGVALAAGAVWFLLAPAHDAPREPASAGAASLRAVPAVGPSSGGLLVSGSF